MTQPVTKWLHDLHPTWEPVLSDLGWRHRLRYGTLRTWAQELGMSQAVTLLETTLKEEKNTDEALTELAETCVNQEAQAEAAQPHDLNTRKRTLAARQRS